MGMDRVPQSKRRRVIQLYGCLTIAIVLICGVTLFAVRSVIMGERRDPQAVLSGATVHSLSELPGDRAYPEALTIGPDGNIYVASFCTGDIWQITPAGEHQTWLRGGEGNIQAASGLAFAPNGALYVIDRGDCSPREGESSIKRISPDRQTIETVGDINENDIPNALAFDSAGTLYLTDTQHGTVRRLNTEDRFETWWVLPNIGDDTARPTGLAYDSVNDALLVADTESGSIYRVGFNVDRGAAQAETLYRQDTRELDGLTVDEQGRIYVTLFNLNTVAMLHPEVGLTILAEDFREPSDVAYLDGVIYVTNFDSLSLAPLVGWLIDPSLPFTVDAITLPTEAEAQ